jgi:hypothetical protein
MHTTVVCVFSDRPTAETAVGQLLRQGVSAARVRWHAHSPTARNASLITADEVASGGFFANLTHLFDQLLGHRPADGNASTYADVVRTEGSLVSVEVRDEDEAQKYEQLLRAAGARHVSTLPAHETVSFHRLYPQLSDEDSARA